MPQIRRRNPTRRLQKRGKVYSFTERLERQKMDNVRERLRTFMERESMPEAVQQALCSSKTPKFLQQLIRHETILRTAIDRIIDEPNRLEKNRLQEGIQQLMKSLQLDARVYPKWFRLFTADSLDQAVQHIRARAILPALEDALTDTAHALRVIEVLPLQKT